MLTLPSPLPADLGGLKQEVQRLIASEAAWIAQGDACAYPAHQNITRWQSMLETLAAIDRQVAA
jgi:hypothetical protein